MNKHIAYIYLVEMVAVAYNRGAKGANATPPVKKKFEEKLLKWEVKGREMAMKGEKICENC